MLAPSLLELLRTWWVEGHRLGKMLPGGWLFPGLDPVDPLSTRQLNRIVKAAAEEAEIAKRVSMHTLRHSCINEVPSDSPPRILSHNPFATSKRRHPPERANRV